MTGSSNYSLGDILDLLEAGPLTTKQIAERLHVSPRGVFILLCTAKESDFVRTVWLDKYVSAWEASRWHGLVR